MNDRELLEAAAKAAGIDLTEARWHEDMGAFVSLLPRTPNWNPLRNDGDALRLAVKLDLLSGPAFWHERSVQYAMAAFSGDRQDPYASTRRAIVRAAAALQTDKE